MNIFSDFDKIKLLDRDYRYDFIYKYDDETKIELKKTCKFLNNIISMKNFLIDIIEDMDSIDFIPPGVLIEHLDENYKIEYDFFYELESLNIKDFKFLNLKPLSDNNFGLIDDIQSFLSYYGNVINYIFTLHNIEIDFYNKFKEDFYLIMNGKDKRSRDRHDIDEIYSRSKKIKINNDLKLKWAFLTEEHIEKIKIETPKINFDTLSKMSYEDGIKNKKFIIENVKYLYNMLYAYIKYRLDLRFDVFDIANELYEDEKFTIYNYNNCLEILGGVDFFNYKIKIENKEYDKIKKNGSLRKVSVDDYLHNKKKHRFYKGVKLKTNRVTYYEILKNNIKLYNNLYNSIEILISHYDFILSLKEEDIKISRSKKFFGKKNVYFKELQNDRILLKK